MTDTLHITLDGIATTAAAKETILAVARRIGVDIPVMCYLDGKRPPESCGVCMVEVDGRRDFQPACVTRVWDGMVVHTNTDAVRRVRRVALELLLSDHIGDCVAPCQLTCPARIDIPDFLRAIEADDARDALAIMKESVAFPGVLGRICPRPCEKACRRRELDEPITIMQLKRFCADAEPDYTPAQSEPTGRRVAVVGAGIAGLTAAYFLRRAGHGCTIFDSNDAPGGILRRAIPAFRLPAEPLDAEIDVLRRLGVAFEMNRTLGRDLALERLRKDFDAVLLATGLTCDPPAEIPGAELARSAWEFAWRARRGEAEKVAARAVVFGPGPTALDTCRTLVRLGARGVTLLVERSAATGLHLADHVEEAQAEGVEIALKSMLRRIEQAPDGALRVTVDRDGTPHVLETDTVYYAADLTVDADLLRAQGVDVSPRGVEVDRATLATNCEGVFAAGSMVHGSMAVQASASGHQAALSISRWLAGEPMRVDEPIHVRMHPLTEEQRAILFRDVAARPRAHAGTLDAATARSGFDEVDSSLAASAARDESARCLQCDCARQHDCVLRRYATEYGADPKAFAGETPPFERESTHADVVFEPMKCIKCGRCILIAEEAREPLGLTYIGRGFRVKVSAAFSASMREGLREAALRCVEVCPTGALYRRRRGR